ncbi:hypothetical protein EJB05_23891, partial [Eragrostis curvula]
MAKAVAMLMFMALMVATMSSAESSGKLDCHPKLLSVCLPALIHGVAPTPGCCANLRAQQDCFCQYKRDPTFRSYLTGVNGQHTLKSCGLATSYVCLQRAV